MDWKWSSKLNEITCIIFLGSAVWLNNFKYFWKVKCLKKFSVCNIEAMHEIQHLSIVLPAMQRRRNTKKSSVKKKFAFMPPFCLKAITSILAFKECFPAYSRSSTSVFSLYTSLYTNSTTLVHVSKHWHIPKWPRIM